ncbi:MAG: signal recognition particle-docking protein FtsY [Candidatus Aenigmatarchaeota archaeon]
MFELLKNKLKKAIKSISEKIEKKEEKPKEIEEKKPEKIFKKIKEKVVKAIIEKQLSEEDVEPILNELTTDLIEADVAYEVAEKIKEDLKKSLVGKPIKRGKEKEVVVEALRQSLLDILSIPEIDLKKMVENKKPFVILFLGFNGSGKTSSLAKLGKWLVDGGYSCVFAASDTFRAASIEQLEEHAKKLGIRVIKHKYGADPAAVAFDAIAHAKANGIDFVLIDTAGRAHTNKNLMEQMNKIVKVAKPDLKVLVVDSLTGNDAVIQARLFNEVGIDAVIFTKVDVNEKGGAVLSVTHELKKPILFLSCGQEYKEIEKYDANKFVNLLLS